MNKLPPSIIPRQEHSISRRQFSPNALRVLYRLKGEGFIAHLVGGCVRDLLLGREPKDFDVVTDATPGQIKRLFRNCRLVGRRFRLAHIHFGDEIIEVATFRAAEPIEPAEEDLLPVPGEQAERGTDKLSRPPRHLKSDEGVVLRDNVFGSPAQDALRRDFTINSLFYDIADFSLIDYAGGLKDLQDGVIRTIGDPTVRFTEDPVRMLRAVRFAALLGFSVEKATWRALLAQSATITRAAPPRLFDEILKLFLTGEGEKSYQLLRQGGLFAALFPHFDRWLDAETAGFPHARLGQALTWVDSCVQRGEKVSPQLLLALVFGEYLAERGETFRRAGAPLQQSLEMAVAEFIGELAPTVLIPNRIAMQLRDILLYQPRLRKTPGTRPLSFISRPFFAAALDYLRFACTASGESPELCRWWENFVRDNQSRPVETTAKEEEPGPLPARRRRRRKRRAAKKEGAAPAQTPTP